MNSFLIFSASVLVATLAPIMWKYFCGTVFGEIFSFAGSSFLISSFIVSCLDSVVSTGFISAFIVFVSVILLV